MGGQACGQQCHECQEQCAAAPGVFQPGLKVPLPHESQWREEAVSSSRSWKLPPSSEKRAVACTASLIHLRFDVPPGISLGVRLTVVEVPPPDGVLVVVSVEPGAVLAATAHGAPGVCPGDAVVEVNGHRGSATLLGSNLQRAARAGGLLLVAVRPRPAAFDAVLSTPGSQFSALRVGLQVSLESEFENQDRIQVHAVRENGLVSDWNARNGYQQVVPGDSVIQVNDISAGAQEMYAEIHNATVEKGLRLRIATPQRKLAEAVL